MIRNSDREGAALLSHTRSNLWIGIPLHYRASLTSGYHEVERTRTDVPRTIAGRVVEKWVARCLLGRVEGKSIDSDHNSHSILAERDGYSEENVSDAIQVWSGNSAAKHSRQSIFPPCLCASVRDLCIFSRRTIAARFTPEVLARLVAWDICPEVAVSVA